MNVLITDIQPEPSVLAAMNQINASRRHGPDACCDGAGLSGFDEDHEGRRDVGTRGHAHANYDSIPRHTEGLCLQPWLHHCAAWPVRREGRRVADSRGFPHCQHLAEKGPLSWYVEAGAARRCHKHTFFHCGSNYLLRI